MENNSVIDSYRASYIAINAVAIINLDTYFKITDIHSNNLYNGAIQTRLYSVLI